MKEGGISKLQSVVDIPYGHASSINLKLSELEVEGEELTQGRTLPLEVSIEEFNMKVSS
jgi:hypothetical protein